jgi:hypothetical protein
MWATRRAVALVVLSGLPACAGDDDAGGGVVITTVSEHGRSPVSGVQVQVDDGEWRTTDEEGRVTFDATPQSYDLRVFQRIDTGSSVAQDVWVLVNQTNLVMTIPVNGSTQPTHEGSITGSVSGTSGDDSHVAVFGGRFPDTGAVGTVAEDGTFQLARFRWEGSSSQRFNLHALESNGGDLPTRYTGFGTASITLDDGGEGATATAEINLAPVDETDVTGTVAVADGIAPSLRPSMTLTLSDGARLTLGDEAALTPGAFEFAIPDLDGATVRLGFEAGDVITGELVGPRSDYTELIALPAKDLTVELPAAVVPVEPAEAATIDHTTRFRWNALPGGDHYGLSLTCAWDGGNVDYRIVETTDTEVFLPDIPGLVIGPYARCAWSIGWYDRSITPIESLTLPSSLRTSHSGQRAATYQ